MASPGSIGLLASTSGQVVAAAGSNVSLWNPQSNVSVQLSVPEPQSDIVAAACGQGVALAVMDDKRIVVWDLEAPASPRYTTVADKRGTCAAVAAAPEPDAEGVGSMLLVGDKQGNIVARPTAAVPGLPDIPQRALQGHTAAIISAVAAVGGAVSLVAAGDSQGCVRVCELPSGHAIRAICLGHVAEVRGLDFLAATPNEYQQMPLCSVDASGEVRLWDAGAASGSKQLCSLQLGVTASGAVEVATAPEPHPDSLGVPIERGFASTEGHYLAYSKDLAVKSQRRKEAAAAGTGELPRPAALADAELEVAAAVKATLDRGKGRRNRRNRAPAAAAAAASAPAVGKAGAAGPGAAAAGGGDATVLDASVQPESGLVAVRWSDGAVGVVAFACGAGGEWSARLACSCTGGLALGGADGGMAWTGPQELAIANPGRFRVMDVSSEAGVRSEEREAAVLAGLALGEADGTADAPAAKRRNGGAGNA